MSYQFSPVSKLEEIENLPPSLRKKSRTLLGLALLQAVILFLPSTGQILGQHANIAGIPLTLIWIYGNIISLVILVTAFYPLLFVPWGENIDGISNLVERI